MASGLLYRSSQRAENFIEIFARQIRDLIEIYDFRFGKAGGRVRRRLRRWRLELKLFSYSFLLKAVYFTPVLPFSFKIERDAIGRCIFR